MKKFVLVAAALAVSVTAFCQGGIISGKAKMINTDGEASNVEMWVTGKGAAGCFGHFQQFTAWIPGFEINGNPIKSDINYTRPRFVVCTPNNIPLIGGRIGLILAEGYWNGRALWVLNTVQDNVLGLDSLITLAALDTGGINLVCGSLSLVIDGNLKVLCK